MYQVEDLVAAALAETPSELETAFRGMMLSRASDAVDGFKAEIAATIFSKSDAGEENNV
jgi:hypothetical protein